MATPASVDVPQPVVIVSSAGCSFASWPPARYSYFQIFNEQNCVVAATVATPTATSNAIADKS